MHVHVNICAWEYAGEGRTACRRGASQRHRPKNAAEGPRGGVYKKPRLTHVCTGHEYNRPRASTRWCYSFSCAGRGTLCQTGQHS